MNSYHLSLINTIREAYHALRDIPADQWQSHGYYDHATGRSDMMGWYVRLIAEPQRPASGLSATQYRVKAAPLSHAINELLDYCLSPEINFMDAYSIAPGYHHAFRHEHTRDRCIAALELILDKCDVPVPPLHKIPAAQSQAPAVPIRQSSDSARTPAARYFHKA